MAVKLAPQPRQQYEIAGSPASGAKLFTYVAGSTTKQTTFTTSVGDVANTNPIILNSEGRTPYGVWLTTGLNYKFVLSPSTDTDPPTSPVFSEDVVSGINDTAAQITSQWNESGLSPIFVSTTQFTLSGDQTVNFQVDRRIRLVNTAGTMYGRITVSAYTTLTTITVVLDSGVLDSGLSSVSLGLLTVTNPSIAASGVTNTPSGTIVSTTVQAAINELRLGSSSQTFSVATATATAHAMSQGAGDARYQNSTVGQFRNLAASANGVSANVSVSVDEIVVESAANLYQTLRAVALTIAGTSVGANGIDAGTIAASTWYSLWVIWNGTTTAGLMSLSATAPTLPTGYTHKARVGWISTDGTANKYPLSFKQFGRKVQYVVAAGSNVGALPIMASGLIGSASTPTYVAVSTTSYVPASASEISVAATVVGGDVLAAPNGAYGNYSSVTNAPPIHAAYIAASFPSSAQGKMMLESANIYMASSNATCELACIGWEDNL